MVLDLVDVKVTLTFEFSPRGTTLSTLVTTAGTIR